MYNLTFTSQELILLTSALEYCESRDGLDEEEATLLTRLRSALRGPTTIPTIEGKHK